MGYCINAISNIFTNKTMNKKIVKQRELSGEQRLSLMYDFSYNKASKAEICTSDVIVAIISKMKELCYISCS